MLDKPKSSNPPGVEALVRRWQQDRDESARDKLVRLYMPAISRRANLFAGRWKLDPDDATQEASLGFLRALETYDPAIASLEVYMTVWAYAKVGRSRGSSTAITIPGNKFNDVGKVAKVRAKLRQKLGRPPSAAEIGEILGYGVVRTEGALAALAMPSSIKSVETPLGEDGLTLGDTLADDDSHRPDVVALHRKAASDARGAILAAVEPFVPGRAGSTSASHPVGTNR